ncbi:beta-lactamase family protein [Shewanella submarina]|uniref:Serine hydrolase domain-containing protein n=1 Tax=Shewanella submarina TaxID=2016376 RepID=A0ABV7GJK2_9GAMM|nr:serine hydrolase domain-containing protein [Shewanella submarina]MCL1035886.1 beta-lactamase family protein [Shewanella submarina]
MKLPGLLVITSLIALLISPLGLTAHASAINQFNHAFAGMLESHQLPGAVVHVKHKGKLIVHQAIGVRNLDAPMPIRTDDIFRIYSMTKPVTAVALLQLVDQGKVDLDADIRRYLPGFEPFEFDGQPQIVTVHHLLSHTAGFGYGGGLKSWIDIRYLLANPLSRNNSLDDLVDDLSGIELKFAPGSRFEYSIASDIQGAIIEAVTNQPLDQYFEEHIFGPLQMSNTGFAVPAAAKHRLVDMYEYDASTFEQALTFNKEDILFVETGSESEYLSKPTLISAGGGLVSTAQDYANFVGMLLNGGEFNGKRILSNELLTKMLSSHTQGLDTHFLPRIYENVGFGYGLAVEQAQHGLRPQGSFFWAGMGGTLFWGDPHNDLQVVVMFQVEDGWIALEKWLLPEIYKLIQDDKLNAAINNGH